MEGRPSPRPWRASCPRRTPRRWGSRAAADDASPPTLPSRERGRDALAPGRVGSEMIARRAKTFGSPYQRLSELTTSPPALVATAHQVCWLTLSLMNLTEP